MLWFSKIKCQNYSDIFRIPKVENVLEDINEADVFTVPDLKSAYLQIRINEFDKHKTAFAVPDAKY